jgi:hypothetical protein
MSSFGRIEANCHDMSKSSSRLNSFVGTYLLLSATFASINRRLAPARATLMTVF